MFDITLRHTKDRIANPLCFFVPKSVSPLHITGAAFVCGILACLTATDPSYDRWSLLFWCLNRALDGLDGAVARKRATVTELGGFLDLLGDFIVYSFLPIAITLGQELDGFIEVNWISVAVLEASFHINNFVLFYISAVAAKREEKELTSVTMRPALIEGLESGLLFTAMLIWPEYINFWCWTMSAAVGFGICQRVLWVTGVLQKVDEPKSN
ncbi:hypothetical protein MMC16_002949 [Acarospora aff. strigata]|nr:hypothetical protein [Acarospora aff. strigata]